MLSIAVRASHFGADIEFVVEDGDGLVIAGDDMFLDVWDGAVEGGLGELTAAIDEALFHFAAAFGHLAAEITDVIGWAAGDVTE